jgi:hypothetical protein
MIADFDCRLSIEEAVRDQPPAVSRALVAADGAEILLKVDG